MKARLHLFLFVLAAFALALPAPAFASLRLHSLSDAYRDWLVGKTKTNGSLSTTLYYTNDVAGNVVAMKSSTANEKGSVPAIVEISPVPDMTQVVGRALAIGLAAGRSLRGCYLIGIIFLAGLSS